MPVASIPSGKLINKSERLLELDVLRGIAALGVGLFHYTSEYDDNYGHSKKLLFYFPYGIYGVELFFIISGLVIFMTLKKDRSSLDFLVGRFSRLYPAYWAAIIVTFTVVTVAGLPDRRVSLSDALINLTMLQKFFEVPHVDGVYWTLALELSFYFIMFVLHKTRLLRYIDTVAIVWLLLMVLKFGLDKYADLEVPADIKNFLLLDYANLFITGIMLYKIDREGFSAKRSAIIAACLLVYQLKHSWQETLTVAGLVLVFHLVLKRRLTFMVWQPLIFMGTISYSFYLLHQNIGYVMIRTLYKFEINPNVIIVITLISSILLATAITFIVERPMVYFLRAQYRKVFKEPSVNYNR